MNNGQKWAKWVKKALRINRKQEGDTLLRVKPKSIAEIWAEAPKDATHLLNAKFIKEMWPRSEVPDNQREAKVWLAGKWTYCELDPDQRSQAQQRPRGL